MGGALEYPYSEVKYLLEKAYNFLVHHQVLKARYIGRYDFGHSSVPGVPEKLQLGMNMGQAYKYQGFI